MADVVNGKTGEMIRWILSLVFAGLVAYFTSQAALDKRLTVLEDRMQRTNDDIREVKADVRQLLQVIR